MQNFTLEFVKQISADLTINDIMTTDVITLHPDNKLKNAKEIMRLRKISGIPIVDQNKRLLGIISIDDIIQGLEYNKLDNKINSLMSTDLITVNNQNNSIGDVLFKFKKYKFGRLPVIDNNNKLVGIITPGDITRKLLSKVKEKISEDSFAENGVRKEDEEASKEEVQPLELQIEGGNFKKGGNASSRIKKTLQQLEISAAVIRKAAIVIYEAEMNVIIHAKRGKVLLEVDQSRIKITVEDSGPGIKDVESAMEPGYSTASEYIRELGFGAGMGLANIKRYSDELNIDSKVSQGTKIEAEIYLESDD
ncbi:CBS domain-containing protein [Acetohalobium arabaticum]|uniref:Putative signal transduction protein with CBS domains n=1 Tax=Acetohalobium arabaticum (strain ATCC 49924 / DSM 5501 / Z-7288) TaxID=574087 RepID=D9QS27_ACEAZ|nr:CBS domain-containing protein [Acetohalobium arabaticum]ADL13318.1 putative signal transduction protein with CBS domains [Acetohalobium arabaticum DSM 5501]